MPTNCVNFHKAEPGNTCDNILAEHREITRDQFFGWNPVLAGDCNGLWANNYYCVGAYSNGNLPQPPTVNTKPSPVPPDSASNCVAWYKTTDGDTCADIGTMFGSFSDKEFKAWNPAVGGDCSGLRVSGLVSVDVLFRVIQLTSCAGRLLVLRGRSRHAHDENNAAVSLNYVLRYLHHVFNEAAKYHEPVDFHHFAAHDNN
jgi:hypothetical protein